MTTRTVIGAVPPMPSARLLPRKYLAHAIAFAFVSLLLFANVRTLGSPLDEGMLLAGADLVHRGLKPGLDFNYTYGPASLWAVLAQDAIFGLGLMGERLLGILYRYSILAGLYALSRPRGQGTALGSVGIGALILGSMLPGAFAWLAAIALLLGSLTLASRAFGRETGGFTFFASGLLGAFALSFRPDLGLAALLMLLPLFLLASLRDKARFVFGVSAGLLPLGWHVVGISPERFYRALVVEPRLMMPGRMLPIPPTHPEDRFLFFATVAAALAWLAFGIVRVARDRRSVEARTTLSIGLLSLALLPQVIQRADSWHIFYGAIVSVALLPILIADAIASLRTRSPLVQHATLGSLLVLGPLLAKAPTTLRQPLLNAPSALFDTRLDGYEVHRRGRSFRLATKEQALEAEALLGGIDEYARPGERIFIGPRDLRRTNYNDTYLYYLLPELVPATYFTALVPGLDADKLAAEIASADLLALTSAYDDWNEPNTSMVFGSDALNQLVKERFCPLSRHGSYTLLNRCDD